MPKTYTFILKCHSLLLNRTATFRFKHLLQLVDLCLQHHYITIVFQRYVSDVFVVVWENLFKFKVFPMFSIHDLRTFYCFIEQTKGNGNMIII